MLESYEIETNEQLRAIADMRRARILELLRDQPMTVTQLGELMGEAPAKIHYHVRELEKVGLLRLVETREKGGILEKYYQPIARSISVEKQLFAGPPDEAVAAIGTLINQVKEGFQRAFRTALEQKDEHPKLMIGTIYMYITDQEQKQLAKQVLELLKPYENRRGIEGEQEILTTILAYPTQAGPSPAPDAAAPLVQDDKKTDPIGITLSVSSDDSTSNTWAVGVTLVSRSELEEALAEGKRVSISVVGLCRFADDISAELADRAVEQLHLIGKLQASPEVREVLMKKRSG
jgi:DNA-binding transcriptional ArsR family regulator